MTENSYLLITKPDSPDVEVSDIAIDLHGPNWGSVFPYHFLRKTGLVGAELIDERCMLFEVCSYRITRPAKRSETEFSWGSYVFNMLVLLLFLTPLVRVEMVVRPKSQMDLRSVKARVNELVKRNPDAYTHESPTRIRRLILTCRSVRSIGLALMGDPTPNDV